MSYVPRFTDFSKADYDGLDGSQKKQILKALTKIEEKGMNAGQPLHGRLWDCRKLKHKKLGLRMVFRQSVEGIELVEIVVIGRRENDEVYETALERLGRV